MRIRPKKVECVDYASGSENFSFDALPRPQLPFHHHQHSLSSDRYSLIMEATTMANKPMPSQAQLALAMAIVKQKPAGMDIQG